VFEKLILRRILEIQDENNEDMMMKEGKAINQSVHL
jgi:hypothetical protein